MVSDDEEQIDDTNNAQAGMESDDNDSGAGVLLLCPVIL